MRIRTFAPAYPIADMRGGTTRLMPVGMAIRPIAFTVSALLALATPALAQDGSEAVANRTPASAQKFLSTLLPYQFNGDGKPFVTTAITSTDACKTELIGDEIAFNAGKGDFLPTPGKEGQHLVIDWSTVEKIAEVGGTPDAVIALSTPNSSHPQGWILAYKLSETRDRVIAAARYLKDACDKTKELGF